MHTFQIWSHPPVHPFGNIDVVTKQWINARMGAEQHTHKQPVIDVQTVRRSIDSVPFLIQIPCYIQVSHLDATIQQKQSGHIQEPQKFAKIFNLVRVCVDTALCTMLQPSPGPTIQTIGCHFGSIWLVLEFHWFPFWWEHIECRSHNCFNCCKLLSILKRTTTILFSQSTQPPVECHITKIKSLATRRQRSYLHDANHVGRELG